MFGSCGVYHYWHGENANHFLYEFKLSGLDPHTTKFALDVEEPGLPYYLAGRINTFFKQLIDYGFKPGNLWVYTNVLQFLQSGRIIIRHLKYGFIWGAKYATMNEAYNLTLSPNCSFSPHLNAWQFNGVGQDLSYDYTGTLVQASHPTRRKPKRKVAPKETATYVKSGTRFKTLTDISGYADLNFKVKNGNELAKGSVIKGRPVKFGHITRLNTSIGFFTSNTKYLKAVK